MKKTICLLTDWYPTKDNPYQGCFFKEQAFALEENFDFVVFRFQERRKKLPFQRDTVSICNKEKNTVEYQVIAYIPLLVSISDFIHTIRIRRSGQLVNGIEKYASEYRKRLIRKKIKALFKEVNEKVDAFYCVDAQNESFFVQCLAEEYRRPYVVGEHAPVPLPGMQIVDVQKYAIEKANLFLAISNDKIRQLLLQNIVLPKTVYIGNLIDERKFVYKPREMSALKTFIIVAAHSFYKNYDMFIQVMNKLVELTDKEFRVMIVGYGANKGYSQNVESLEKKIKMSKFAKYAELIREVSRDDICEVYNRADAFIMTSIQEGQPVSALEAACCGLPIFSTRCGGVEDYVDDQIGRIYDITDVDGMAGGLKDYLEEKIVFEPHIIREKIVEKFGTRAFERTFTDAFNGVMNID